MKRLKLSDPSSESTIAALIRAKMYTTVEEIVKDVETALSLVADKLQEGLAKHHEQPLSASSQKLQMEMAQARALKSTFDNLILREIIQRPRSLNPARHRSGSWLERETSSDDSAINPGPANVAMISRNDVLTLYGSAPIPKQLFSSLRHPVEAGLQRSKPGQNGVSETTFISQKSHIAGERALPNGISTTKIVPTQSLDPFEVKKDVPTLGELFPPPITLPPLNPPKQSRHTATRSSSITWVHASESSASTRIHRRDAYPMQPLSTGQWLTYNVAPSPTQLSSPEARRKQRDRALSFGETQPAIPHEDVVAHSQVKEDALFRSVYSSFAPDRDNAAAIVPERTKNRIWWKRYGEKKFQDYLDLSYSVGIDEKLAETTNNPGAVDGVDGNDFQDAVDNWTPEPLPPELVQAKDGNPRTPEISREVNEILQEISELLETLNSYQRIRNLSLASNTRTMTNSKLGAISGSPTSPSSAEFDVYNMLKSQLALMVSVLPPYALAKLDGNKLGALNISAKIRVEDKNYRGTMEEEANFGKAKQMASAPVPTYPPRPVNASLGHSSRMNGYVHPTASPVPQNPRSSYTTQPRPASTSTSQLPNQQYSSRPASANHYFTGNSHSSYPPQRTASSASERYSYSATQQYSQRPSQPTNIQYSKGYRSYPASNGTSYGQQYATPPHTTTAPSVAVAQTQRPSQPGYQQRAMNSQSYNYVSGASGREASPSKPTAAFTPPSQRATHPPQGQASSQAHPPLYRQHSSQYSASTSASRPAHGSDAVAPSGPHTHMTPDEQSALMNRQKAQLAEQQIASSRQGSGTPQPVTVNPTARPNGTAMVQSNGVAAGQEQ